MKICGKCRVEKDFSCFGLDKRAATGLRSECKQCRKDEYNKDIEKYKEKNRISYQKHIEKRREYDKKRYAENKEEYSIASKKYRIKNKEKLEEYSKTYYENNKEEIKEASRAYHANNKEARLTYRRNYYQLNKERELKSSKEYCKKNKEKVNKYAREYQSAFRKTIRGNLIGKIRGIIRRCIKIYYKKGKSRRSIEYFGCDLDTLINHIKSLFTEGMTEQALLEGKIHIDHIKPLCSFSLDSEESMAEANFYLNLRPMWAKDNLAKIQEDMKQSLRRKAKNCA